MILREFPYVDTDKVRAMLAQLDGGIAEESRETERTESRTTVGPRAAAQHFRGAGSESYTQKSLGDALFPMLEDALESEGLIRDISEEVADAEQWNSGELKKSAPPGSLVRISAPGSLFDARYMASAFSAFGAVNVGLQGIGASPAPASPPHTKGKQGQGQRRSTPKATTPALPQLEDSIPGFPDIGGTSGSLLRSFVQISRGIFAPGLHINLTPAAGVLIGARLQEGRQYLDSEADILFARYGTEKQEWTLMGSVGSYGTEETELPEIDFCNSDGSVNRGDFAESMNAQMRNLGRIGFIDLPQYPGFSVVPFAVYRSIPRAGSVALRER
ncbi:hypothetical protein ACFRAO_39550 [Streptomyces sp. NPDC056656]|uniref:DUF6414 family protein n=1 Tax=Streptomyces sp. NPDC056656 TaxID=3345895 RepID=UPI0036BF6236